METNRTVQRRARDASAIIATADQQTPPLRLALGSDAYGGMHRALSDRFDELEGQKDLAASIDGK